MLINNPLSGVALALNATIDHLYNSKGERRRRSKKESKEKKQGAARRRAGGAQEREHGGAREEQESKERRARERRGRRARRSKEQRGARKSKEEQREEQESNRGARRSKEDCNNESQKAREKGGGEQGGATSKQKEQGARRKTKKQGGSKEEERKEEHVILTSGALDPIEMRSPQDIANFAGVIGVKGGFQCVSEAPYCALQRNLLRRGSCQVISAADEEMPQADEKMRVQWSLERVLSKNWFKDVTQAYRRLARTCHPDKGGNKEEFQGLVAAYELLTMVGIPNAPCSPQAAETPFSRIFAEARAARAKAEDQRKALVAFHIVKNRVEKAEKKAAEVTRLFNAFWDDSWEQMKEGIEQLQALAKSVEEAMANTLVNTQLQAALFGLKQRYRLINQKIECLKNDLQLRQHHEQAFHIVKNRVEKAEKKAAEAALFGLKQRYRLINQKIERLKNDLQLRQHHEQAKFASQKKKDKQKTNKNATDATDTDFESKSVFVAIDAALEECKPEPTDAAQPEGQDENKAEDEGLDAKTLANRKKKAKKKAKQQKTASEGVGATAQAEVKEPACSSSKDKAPAAAAKKRAKKESAIVKAARQRLQQKQKLDEEKRDFEEAERCRVEKEQRQIDEAAKKKKKKKTKKKKTPQQSQETEQTAESEKPKEVTKPEPDEAPMSRKEHELWAVCPSFRGVW
eukprot:s829_g2.t2